MKPHLSTLVGALSFKSARHMWSSVFHFSLTSTCYLLAPDSSLLTPACYFIPVDFISSSIAASTLGSLEAEVGAGTSAGLRFQRRTMTTTMPNPAASPLPEESKPSN